MPVNPKIRKTALFVLGTAAVLLTLPLTVPLALPFLLGLGVALLSEPIVRFLQNRAKLPRALGSVLSVGALLLLLGTVLFFLLRVLLNELTDLSSQLPDLILQMKAPVERLQQWMQSLISRLPARTAQALTDRLSGLFSGSSYLMQSLSQRLLGFLSGLLTGMPGAMIGTVTTLLAAFFTSASLPELRAALQKKLAKSRLRKLSGFACRVKKTLGCWFLAQAELAGISCAVLCAGLALLRVDYWLLLGLLIALIDALPVLGAGLVLIPWALLAFLQSDQALGVGLLLLYVCVLLLRSALEPKLVGEKVGLPPLVSLAAFYAGWRLMGAFGMILFPIGTVLIGQIYSLLKPESA